MGSTSISNITSQLNTAIYHVVKYNVFQWYLYHFKNNYVILLIGELTLIGPNKVGDMFEKWSSKEGQKSSFLKISQRYKEVDDLNDTKTAEPPQRCKEVNDSTLKQQNHVSRPKKLTREENREYSAQRRKKGSFCEI